MPLACTYYYILIFNVTFLDFKSARKYIYHGTIQQHISSYKGMTSNDVTEHIIKLSSTVRMLSEQQRTLQKTIDKQAERLLVIDEMAYEFNKSQAIISRLEEQLENKTFVSGTASYPLLSILFNIHNTAVWMKKVNIY